MIRALATFAVFVALAAAAAYAQTTSSNYPMIPYANPVGPEVNGGLSGPMIPGGSGGGAGGCSNSLDFSQACNSQYLGMMRF